MRVRETAKVFLKVTYTQLEDSVRNHPKATAAVIGMTLVDAVIGYKVSDGNIYDALYGALITLGIMPGFAYSQIKYMKESLSKK